MKAYGSWFFVVGFFGALATAGGCADVVRAQDDLRSRSATPASEAGSLSIATVQPPPARPLRVGEQVEMRVEVDYAIGVDGATLELVVHGADNAVLARRTEVAPRGSWRTMLKVSFTVPESSNINAALLLHARGIGFVGAEAVTYRIVP